MDFLKNYIKKHNCIVCGYPLSFKHVTLSSNTDIWYKCSNCCLVEEFLFPNPLNITGTFRFKDLPKDVQEYLLENGLYFKTENPGQGYKPLEQCPYCGSNNVIIVREYDFTYVYKGEKRDRHDIFYLCKDCSSFLVFGLFKHIGKEFNNNLEDYRSYLKSLDVKFNDIKCPHCGKPMKKLVVYLTSVLFNAIYRCENCMHIVRRLVK